MKRKRGREEKEKIRRIGEYVYSSRCGLLRGGPEQTERESPPPLCADLFISREIFLKRRE